MMNQSKAINTMRGIMNVTYSVDNVCGPVSYNECIAAWAHAAFMHFSNEASGYIKNLREVLAAIR